jgi:ubiquinone/menaquinone biosynthesis C-methylase UbiE
MTLGLSMREEDSEQYWDKTWALEVRRLRERCTLDGSDGEEEFDRELLKRTAGKTVLDEGCGSGVLTLKIARRAMSVIGIDTSTIALEQSKRNLVRSKLANVDFRRADATNLPFPDRSFDIVYSRRGPGSDSARTLAEAYRVSRKNGVFMEITIGERDKHNLARIFGRGQMLSVKGRVSERKKMMLEKARFTRAVTRDYIGTEVFRAMSDLLVRLRSAPIIPSFDPNKDRKCLAKIRKECMTDRGIETPVHRVVLIGHK